MNFKKIAFLFSIFVSQQVLALSVAPFVPPETELLRDGNCQGFTQVFEIADAKENYHWDGLWANYFNRLSIPKRIECLNTFEVSIRHRLLLAGFNTELLKAWHAHGGDLNLVRNSQENLSTLAAGANNLELLIWLRQSGIKQLSSTDTANEFVASSRYMGPKTRFSAPSQEFKVKVYDWLLVNNYQLPINISVAHELLLNLSIGYFRSHFKDACENYKKNELLETIIKFERNKLQELNSSKFLEFDSLRKDSNISASKFFVYKLKSCDLDTSLE